MSEKFTEPGASEPCNNVFSLPSYLQGPPIPAAIAHLNSRGVFDAIVLGHNYKGEFVMACADHLTVERAIFLLETAKQHFLNPNPQGAP